MLAPLLYNNPYENDVVWYVSLWLTLLLPLPHSLPPTDNYCTSTYIDTTTIVAVAVIGPEAVSVTVAVTFTVTVVVTVIVAVTFTVTVAVTITDNYIEQVLD